MIFPHDSRSIWPSFFDKGQYRYISMRARYVHQPVTHRNRLNVLYFPGDRLNKFMLKSGIPGNWSSACLFKSLERDMNNYFLGEKNEKERKNSFLISSEYDQKIDGLQSKRFILKWSSKHYLVISLPGIGISHLLVT